MLTPIDPQANMTPPPIDLPLLESPEASDFAMADSPDSVADRASETGFPDQAVTPADWIELNRLKDEFLACVSHELRSPLTALLGLSKLLQDPIIGDLNDRQRRYVQLIHRSGKQLINIVNDILDLTRMETGEIELHPMIVSVPTICQQALEQAQHRIPSQENAGTLDMSLMPQFTLDIDPGLETLIADPMRLQQILRHLLSNALKFTPPDGQVGLRVNRWEGWVAFTVWDTGIGIPTEKQYLIFQKFQQLEHPLTRQFEGTGLGLVLTQRLARLQGGDITFTSREGKGSEFTLLIPPAPSVSQSTDLSIQQEDSRLDVPSSSLSSSPSDLDSDLDSTSVAIDRLKGVAEQTDRPPYATHPNRMVLVVESGVRYLNDIIEQLTELDYRVAIARSGTEALEKARKLMPCAVLLNPNLPLLSGWDVLTLLKSNPDTQGIPLIITATSQPDELRSHGSAVDGFLKLPISPRALAQTLDQVMRRNPIVTGELSSRMILCLHLSDSPEDSPVEARNEGAFPLERFLQANHFRVVEAQDHDQAELLARVWKPQVLVLVGNLADPMPYLKRLVQQTYLASLPIITLDSAITQAAIQTAELAVFPCLHPDRSDRLLQTIDVAIGFAGRPLLLMVDGGQWREDWDEAPGPLDWLQALLQYLQTAGLRGTIAHNATEMQHKLRSQGVDLLLLYLHDGIDLARLRSGIEPLSDLPTPPTVLILDYRTTDHTPLDIPRSLKAKITTSQPTMDGLLQQIQQSLGISN
jgi:signal transduction histidine kinase/DNA-binding response OmpR family regulator